VRRLSRRGERPPAEVLQRGGLPRGERLLAAAHADDGTWLLGTRVALVLVRPQGQAQRVLWEQVASADWDRDQDRLRVVELAEFGVAPVVHELAMGDPGLVLELVRERVTASVLLTRRVAVEPRRGLTVIARRAPGGTGPVVWSYELDPGLDPDDPLVREAAEQGLRSARDELGLDPEVR
jgi:hypothetical protein